MSRVQELSAEQVRGKDYNEKTGSVSNRIAVIHALDESGEPLSRRDLEFEAHLSESQVREALVGLQRDGVVFQARSPDDLRRPQYELVDRHQREQSRERAQVSPFAAIVACGVLYLLVLAVVLVGVVL